MGEYTVVAGDNLTRIASRHGIRYWQNIYLDTANDAFRATRPDPGIIRPGDRIQIPEISSIEPMERHPTFVHRDVPLFTQTAETCWRATGKMLYLRRFPASNEAEFEARIGPRYRILETGLATEYWTDFYARALGMTEMRITGTNDLHRILATRGPVVAAIGSGESAHSMIVAGYDILRGRWLVLDPAAGEELTFADDVIVVGGTSRTPSGSSSGAQLAAFRTGPATWENMSRWLWIFDTSIHERVFHY